MCYGQQGAGNSQWFGKQHGGRISSGPGLVVNGCYQALGFVTFP
jgi:hypothetical protein